MGRWIEHPGITGTYSIALFGAIIATFALMSLVAVITDVIPVGVLGGYDIYLINFGIPFTCGVVIFALLGRWAVANRRWRKPVFAHFTRTLALYAVLALLIPVLVDGWTNQDFWLMGQIVLWPALTSAGGIVGDVVAAVVVGRKSVAQPGAKHGG